MIDLKPEARTGRAIARVDQSGPRTLPGLLDEQASRFGDRPLLTVAGQTISFAQCRAGVARFAAAIGEAGIRRGDRVALMLRNGVDFVWAFLGCQWAGAIAVPLNTALRGPQLAHPLNLVQARLVVADGTLLEHLLAVAAPGVEAIWCVGETRDAREVQGIKISALRYAEDGARMQPLLAQDPSAILFTSGTTGPSKGATYPAEQLIWWGRIMAEMNSLTEDSVSFTTLPLFHIHALSTLVQSMLMGSRCVMTERFSASQFWIEAAAAGATHGCLVGAMGAMLLAQPFSPAERAHSMHTIFSSSLRSSVWCEFSERFGVARRVGGYGSTETNAAFYAETGWETQGRMGSVVAGFEARVVNPEGGDVGEGVPGELLLRTRLPNAFCLGYWDQPEETARSWKGGWFQTGDLVSRDAEGNFRFVGRTKESIRRRGENISAWEVEQAVLTHVAVQEAAAFGVPSDLGDEEVMVVLVLREGWSLDFLDLLGHLDGRIAYFAIPRFLEIADKLPVTETGKLRRSELKERGVGSLTFDRDRSGWKVSRV